MLSKILKSILSLVVAIALMLCVILLSGITVNLEVTSGICGKNLT